jgi:hypothetical protein
LAVCDRAALRGELGTSSLVPVDCEAVDHECVAKEVEVLAAWRDPELIAANKRVRSPQ